MTSIGIITYSNQKYEWMLPWWTHHLQLHTPFPIAYIDNGLSDKMKQWCIDKGTLIPFTSQIDIKPKESISLTLQKQWESQYFGNVWLNRLSWHVKPEILRLSPFDITLYLDIDCEVKKPIFELFHIDHEFAICEEPLGKARYNSGVILYNKNSKVLDLWHERSQRENHLYMGDEDLLSEILEEQSNMYITLNSQYNCRPKSENQDSASIIHHVGLGGKRDIMASILEIF
ncbi:MAG: hypothetical protein P0S95_03050 [Rhabdochlamydiaceae bacterium]|nr:hypothetical protein [Candidatus Amphrikana amoebophyrae]